MDEAALIKLITGRDPTDEQITRIRLIASALSLGENDAFLTIITALDAYHGAIGDIPRRIDDAGKTAVDSAEAMAAAAAVQAAATAREHIERAVDITAFARDWRRSIIRTMVAVACMVLIFCIGVFCLVNHGDTKTRAALDHVITVLPMQIETAIAPAMKDAARLAADDVIARVNNTLSETITDRVDRTLGFVKPQLPFIHGLMALEEQSPGILSILASKEGLQVARLLRANKMNGCPLWTRTPDGVATCTFVSP